MGFVRAKQTYHTRVDGRRIRVKEGEIRSDSDAVVKKSPRRFKPISSDSPSDSGVEEATAAPGQKRKRTRPAKKTASAPAPESEPTDNGDPDSSGNESADGESQESTGS